MDKASIKNVIKSGCSVDHKDLSICDLRNYCYWMKNRERVYQVHNNKFSEIYSDINEAIDKFLELKGNK